MAWHGLVWPYSYPIPSLPNRQESKNKEKVGYQKQQFQLCKKCGVLSLVQKGSESKSDSGRGRSRGWLETKRESHIFSLRSLCSLLRFSLRFLILGWKEKTRFSALILLPCNQGGKKYTVQTSIQLSLPFSFHPISLFLLSFSSQDKLIQFCPMKCTIVILCWLCYFPSLVREEMYGASAIDLKFSLQK